jgi:hypothetical protein
MADRLILNHRQHIEVAVVQGNALLAGGNAGGSDRTRTRGLLRDRQAF